MDVAHNIIKPRYFTLKAVFFTAVLLRATLLVYGEWQDLNFAVKFTDVDYTMCSVMQPCT